MKKIMLLVLLFFSCATYSQIVTRAEIESVVGDDIDFVKTALNIRDKYGLDKNNAITNTYVIDVPGKTKEQIFVEANNWFVHSFVNSKSVIDFNDKEEGVIIAKGYIPHVASHNSIGGASEINAWVIIRVDIKNHKFRIMTTIQKYDMEVITLATAMASDKPLPVEQLPSECFPFKGKTFKKTFSKAFVYSHVWSLIIIDKLSEAVINGITGTEDDW